jgi:hypothetical protein
VQVVNFIDQKNLIRVLENILTFCELIDRRLPSIDQSQRYYISIYILHLILNINKIKSIKVNICSLKRNYGCLAYCVMDNYSGHMTKYYFLSHTHKI